MQMVPNKTKSTVPCQSPLTLCHTPTLTNPPLVNSYLKIGACRHGERCSRKHIKPQFSTTIVVYNMYQNPMHNPQITSNPHLRPPGAPPVDPNALESKMTEEETNEYFEKFCMFSFTLSFLSCRVRSETDVSLGGGGQMRTCFVNWSNMGMFWKCMCAIM